MHPLTEDISKLKDEELQKKINKLYSILNTNVNIDVRIQVEQLLGDYITEQSFRDDDKMKKQLEKNGAKLDEIINIS